MLATVQAAHAAPADFSWAPDPPVVNTETIFSAVEDDSITVYKWDLDGDGRYDDASGRQVKRTFLNVKVYEIGLFTLDLDGDENEKRKDVTVVSSTPPPLNEPPAASFVFFPAGPIAGQPVTFVSTSTDPDSAIPTSGLDWDLNGDGVFDDAEGASATTTYPVQGTYTVSLRVTTNATDLATLVLNVGAPGAPGMSGQQAFSPLSPFPVVRIAGRVSRRGARIRRLTVDAPPSTDVNVRCSGRGCPFKRMRRTVSARVTAGRATRLLRIRRLEGRLLRPGATLRLFVTRAGGVGKYTRFRIRKAKPPSRADMCLASGSGRPVACQSR
jgi:hypothetical protein